jgi:hypothetical protein
MSKASIPARNDQRIMFRPSPHTFAALSDLGERQGISPSIVARRILEEMVHAGPVRQTLDLMVDRILVLDELIRIMLSDVEAERVGEAEYVARLRAISLREGDCR